MKKKRKKKRKGRRPGRRPKKTYYKGEGGRPA